MMLRTITISTSFLWFATGAIAQDTPEILSEASQCFAFCCIVEGRPVCLSDPPETSGPVIGPRIKPVQDLQTLLRERGQLSMPGGG